MAAISVLVLRHDGFNSFCSLGIFVRIEFSSMDCY